MTIRRIAEEQRLSGAVVGGGLIWLAGQVADDATQDIVGQTRQVLAAIDRLLAEAGSDKTRILRAQVFLADIADYAGMNAAWDAWVPAGAAPARATVEARLARPEWRVEVVVTAATA